MAHTSLEVKTNFREYALPPKNVDSDPDIDDDGQEIIRGYDEVDFASMQPVEHRDIGRALLERQAEGVATTALANVIRFPGLYEDLRTHTIAAVEEGVLDLESQFPNDTPEARVSLFVSKTVVEKLKMPTEKLLEDVDPSKMSSERSEIKTPVVLKLEKDLEKLENERRRQQFTILELRQLFKDQGATEEQLLAFDKTAKIRTGLQVDEARSDDQDATTEEVRTHARFVDIVRKGFAKISLRGVGVRAPHSAEVTVVK